MGQNSFYFGRLRATLLLPYGARDVPVAIRTYCYNARFCKDRLSVYWLYSNNKIQQCNLICERYGRVR